MPVTQKIAPGRLFIGGQWVDAVAANTFATVNPATEEPITQVAEGRAEDIDRAVKAARQAFEGPWAGVSAADRGRLLWKMADLIESRLAEIAEVETLDSGKTITESSREIGRASCRGRMWIRRLAGRVRIEENSKAWMQE